MDTTGWIPLETYHWKHGMPIYSKSLHSHPQSPRLLFIRPCYFCTIVACGLPYLPMTYHESSHLHSQTTNCLDFLHLLPVTTTLLSFLPKAEKTRVVLAICNQHRAAAFPFNYNQNFHIPRIQAYIKLLRFPFLAFVLSH